MALPDTSLGLINRLRGGVVDEKAWRIFLDRYEDVIKVWCKNLRLSPADCDDVTQEVLVRLARAMQHFEYDNKGSFRAYLRTVVVNAVRNFHRDLTSRPGARGRGGSWGAELLSEVVDPDSLESLAELISSSLDLDVERLSKVAEIVQTRVSPSTWLAFWKTAVEGLSATEASAELNMTPSGVFKAKSRVRQVFREEWELRFGPWTASAKKGIP